ncbi:MAG: hypothetical protein WCJ03_00090 [Bacteroidales bacterium]
MKNRLLTFLFLLLQILMFSVFAQKPYEVASYPDESGFQLRIKNALTILADKGFGKISLSFSRCPDTGLPVYKYAIEGEEIISPYTGKKYKQPATDYFAAKQRNEQGEITAFGGDPLKYDLPPATASMLLGRKVKEVKYFLSIPGNLSQQYHFAAKNWVRFYALLADTMGDTWKLKLQKAVANYNENTRVSDDGKRWLKLSYPHNLVGQTGYLLGGNAIDGGTENHKIMWRTSGLLYAQLFPDTAKISGMVAPKAATLTKEMLRDFLKKLLVSGNGEYDSEIYYPHSIEGFLNLYDFSPDSESRQLAKFALDYYFATYGLKSVDGMIAGAQKRGYLCNGKPSEMETMLWVFAGVGSWDFKNAEIPIHITTTKYRPNKVILNIIQKKLSLPFESKMSRPFYNMDKSMAFAESFYCSQNYALGNVQNSIVDNPNQQMIWSLVTKSDQHPLCFSGVQPLRGSTSGHSPYTQTLHSKGTMIVMTAATQFNAKIDTASPPTPAGIVRANYWHLAFSEQPHNYELYARQKYASKPLHKVNFPNVNSVISIEQFWNDSKNSASTWFIYPNEIKPKLMNGKYFFETPKAWIALIPLKGSTGFNVTPSNTIVCEMKNEEAKKFFNDYNLISFAGDVSGYVVETTDKSRFSTLADWADSLQKSTKLNFSKQTKTVNYQSAYNERLEMHYQADRLRPTAKLNGKLIDFENYTKGAVYQCPFLSVKNGVMKVTDGISSFTVDFTGNLPVYK